jgi:cytochrome P450
MMRVAIKGEDKLIAAMLKAPLEVQKELRKAIKSALNTTIKNVISSSDKGYVSRSNALDKSMYSTAYPNGLGGSITLSKTISNAPYALAQHEGAKIRQTVTNKQSIFLTKKFKKYIAPGAILNITLKPLKFLTRVWESDKNKQMIFEKVNKGVEKGIKAAGL